MCLDLRCVEIELDLRTARYHSPLRVVREPASQPDQDSAFLPIYLRQAPWLEDDRARSLPSSKWALVSLKMIVVAKTSLEHSVQKH